MLCKLIAILAASVALLPAAPPGAPLKLAVAGLVHGHVDGFFQAVQSRSDVRIVGIFDPDRDLQKHYAQRYKFDVAIFYTDLGTMLDQIHPEAVAIFTSTVDHKTAVEACASRHINAMMEKPLAVSVADARAIQQAARTGGIQVIVNYETTWYRSHAAMHHLIKDEGSAGEIRKMVAMDGHEGPQEIHVGPEFFAWLTDPVKNGAGALFDFGCYGANLMTWMMDNQRPIAVTATTQTFKPQIYAHVDDEANVLVEYPTAIGIIQGSWNWPFSRKDFEVYGAHGYAYAIGGNELRTRFTDQKTDQKEDTRELPELPVDEHDSVSYLTAVARGRLKPSGLSSLENNVIVVEILDAARESARTGKKVRRKAD